jgi:hypothetical protein
MNVIADPANLGEIFGMERNVSFPPEEGKELRQPVFFKKNS